MSCVVETAAEHAAVEGAKKLPEEEEKKPPDEEEKNPGKEEKKEPQVTSSTSEKTQVPVDTDEPISEGGNAMIKKDQTEEHLLAVGEKDDDSEKVKLQEKKVKKRKRRELQQIKQEKLFSDGEEKTHLPLDAQQPHLPCGAEQEHLLAVPEEEDDSEKVKLQENKVKKRKRSELQQIKQEKLFSDAQQPHLPCGAEQEHLLAVADEDDDPEKVKLQKKKVKKRKRSELQQNKEEVQVDAGVPSRWCASYCALLLYRPQTPRYKGSIVLDLELNRIALLDTNETTIDCRHLKEGELIYPGLVLEFPCHKAEIGKQNLEAKQDLPKKKRNKNDTMHEKKRCKLKRKRSDEIARELTSRNQQPLSSPQAKLVGSSIGMFARVAALRKRMSPQAQGNVTTHFPSPNLPRVGADFTRHRPRKLKSLLWKDFIPIYEHGKLVEGKCKHCNEVFPASKSSGTNHIRRHLRKCETRSSMHEMVAKMRASTPSPRVSLDNWTFSQKECWRDLANMIVHHGLPFSIVEYSGFRKFVKSLNPMFRMVSRTTIMQEKRKRNKPLFDRFKRDFDATIKSKTESI